MSFQRKLWTTALATALTVGGLYGLEVVRRNRSTPSDQITHSDTISESYQQSRTIRKLVNPRQHTAITDSHRYHLHLPPQARNISDEALLARMVRGYFGGLMFGPERCALRAYGRPAIYFEEAVPTRAIWSATELSNTSLPPLHSLLFGGFQVIEKQPTHASPSDGDGPSSTESSIHFGFGSNRGQFTGAHRFAVIRKADRLDTVEIVYESLACNPTVNKPLSSLLAGFHMIYAQLLFSDALFGLRNSLDNHLPQASVSGHVTIAADTADGQGPDS